MMPMKKITFNAPLNHKAYSYEPMQIEVEKIIPLYGKRFEQMRDHPLEDAPEIIEKLLAIRWWDWPEERIRAAAGMLQSPDIEAFIKAVEERRI